MELSQLPVIINSYLSIDNIDELRKQAPSIEKVIQNLSLEDLSDNRLSSIITNNILSPFDHRIAILLMDPEKDNRRQTKKNEYIKMSSLLKDIRVRVLHDYKTLLTGSEHLSHYQEKLHSTKSQRRDFLIEPYFEDETYPIDAISSEMFIKMLSKSYKETLAYFKNASQLSDNKEQFEQELYHFVNEATKKLASLSDENESLGDLIEKLENKDESLYRGIKIYTNDLVRDLEDEHNEKLIHLYSENEKISEHIQVLDTMIKYLRSSYIFLRQFNVEKQHNTNNMLFSNIFDNMLEFYQELKIFLSIDVTQEQVFTIFSTENNTSAFKINLIHGEVKDFAYLLYHLQKAIKHEISDYPQWIVERFTIKGKPIVHKTIYNRMGEVARRDGLAPKKKDKLDSILLTLGITPE